MLPPAECILPGTIRKIKRVDEELLSDIRSWRQKLPGITELARGPSQAIIDYVALNFVSDRRKLWWWENLSVVSKSIEYREEDSLEIIRGILSPDDVVFLLVTDDEHEPWPVMEGRLEELLILIGEQRYFEFVLVNRDKEWCVFDTHCNTLVIAGLQDAVG